MNLPKYVVCEGESLPVVVGGFIDFLRAQGSLHYRKGYKGNHITVRTEDTRTQQETLLHEILHLVDRHVSERLKLPSEFTLSEEYVEEFGVILYRTLRDSDLWNPKPEPGIYQLELDLGD